MQRLGACDYFELCARLLQSKDPIQTRPAFPCTQVQETAYVLALAAELEEWALSPHLVTLLQIEVVLVTEHLEKSASLVKQTLLYDPLKVDAKWRIIAV